MLNPLVSVIIPCYNQARFLPEAVESVRAQTYPHWECLIINDGSTDDTDEVGAALAAKDSRVRLINQPNHGLAAARNRGLSEARGQFIQFLDADDVIKPTKFELQVSVVGGVSGLVLSYCDYYRAFGQYLDANKPEAYVSPKFQTENYFVELASRWETQLSIPCHCFLFDARFFTEHGIRFDEALPNHEDWDCWMRIFAQKPSVHYVDAQLAIYRLHPQSTCTDRAKMRRGYLAAIEKQQAIFAGNREMVDVLRRKKREVKRIYRKYGPLHERLLTNISLIGQRLLRRMAKAILPEGCLNFVRSALGRTSS